MALFKYFKRTEGHRETPSLTTNDIKKANESITKALEVKGRGKYNTYTPGQHALLGKYATYNAVLHLPVVSKCLGTRGNPERSCQLHTHMPLILQT